MSKKMGRPSIFPKKGRRVQAELSPVAAPLLEVRRGELARLCAEAHYARPTVISDSDVVEYMVRGKAATVQYLRSQT